MSYQGDPARLSHDYAVLMDAPGYPIPFDGLVKRYEFYGWVKLGDEENAPWINKKTGEKGIYRTQAMKRRRSGHAKSGN